MVPFIELRGSLIYAASAGIDPLSALVVAIAGNMLPVPLIIRFLYVLENFITKFPRLENVYKKIVVRTRNRSSSRVEYYKEIALIAFVAVPLPGTGAWTGSLIAYLFGLKFWKSLVMIFVGVVIAGFAVTLLAYTFI